MPNKVFFPHPESPVFTRSGIDITWTQSTQKLYISGWYDSLVGIEGTEVTLRQFFNLMGITEADCKRAWRKK